MFTIDDVKAALHRVAQSQGAAKRQTILSTFRASRPEDIRVADYDDVIDYCDGAALPSPDTVTRGDTTPEAMRLDMLDAYGKGMGVQEIADALGVSYQRVYYQLTKAGKFTQRRKPKAEPEPAPVVPSDPRKAYIALLRDERAKEAGFRDAADYEAVVAASAADDDTAWNAVGLAVDDFIEHAARLRESGMGSSEAVKIALDVFKAPWAA